MNLSVITMLSFYIFLCVTLLGYSLLYLAGSRGRRRRQRHRAEKWKKTLEAACAPGAVPDRKELAKWKRSLRRVESLAAFAAAVEDCPDPPAVRRCCAGYSEAFLSLGRYYCRRPAMERALFAYVIARCPPPAAAAAPFAELLLAFLERSTVYCRENVLQALYALGDDRAVEQALRLFHQRGWYHYSRMLADGLASFRGDRPALAAALWRACGRWDENLQVAVVQFAANVTDRMGPPFLEALSGGETLPEVRFALVRYFARRPMPQAKPVLLRIVLENVDGGGAAVAGCAALSRYPGGDTRKALERALCSKNWDVRRNAALSLKALGYGEAAGRAACRAGDRYAREMLEAVAGRSSGAEGASL